MATLRIIEGARRGARFALGTRTTIGRSPTCTITLTGERLSRLHAEVRRAEDGRYVLVDCSKNGVLLNHRAVREAALGPGDEVALGDCVLLFEPEPAGAPPPGEGDAPFDTLSACPEPVEGANGSGSADATDDPPSAPDDDAETEVLDSLDAADFGLTDADGGSFSQLAVSDAFNARLLELFDVAGTLHAAQDLRELEARVVEKSLELLGADRAVLLGWDARRQTLVPLHARRLDAAPGPIALARSVLRRVAGERRAILTRRRGPDGARSVLAVPLVAGGETEGVLSLERGAPPFTEADLLLATAVAQQAAGLLVRMRQLAGARAANRRLRRRLQDEVRLIGDSPALAAFRAALARAAASDATVLLFGETGTGKELAARALHEHSARAPGPFVAFNCAAVTESLIESELFGVEKGAYTGAHRARPGRFEQADGGTLLLDEIGDMPAAMQTKLLRVLEERRLDRLGATTPTPVDVRVIAATNVDLDAAVAAGRFRRDLYYRLHVIPLELPSLRARPGDVRLLAEHFLAQFCAGQKRAPMRWTPAALDRLERHSWPGNVRELRNLVERLAVMLADDRIEPHHVPLPAEEEGGSRKAEGGSRKAEGGSAEEGGSRKAEGGSEEYSRLPTSDFRLLTSSPLPELLRRAERDCLVEALRRTGGVKVEAARLLGMSRPTLDKKLRDHGLARPAGDREG